MTTAKRTCPRCGSPLLEAALTGLCRKCLGGLGFGVAANETGSDPGAPVLHRLGDYELIEEIARGGMGVVYRARQLSLQRIVAVKVVLYGPFASEEFVRRFRTEAAAAAGLHHPNIVAIYEVGEQDGHHYFSMELIEGQNLAELVREKPLPARRAAGYLKTIAEAVHYAHQQGVLHRDLKPSNLLLDIFDQPRITDFGLAKFLNSDTDLTTTGQVLGSPNHIPPEQAAGGFAQAGPAGDVYSLGAILYHLLTGRPPFQGETLAEILLQVQRVEPVTPRRLNPSVPEALQTICLKCLQKEPSRRYGSARELADDLGRFLADKPIHAQPVPLAQKLWLWGRRRPVTAALSLGLLLTVMLGMAGILWQWRRAEQHALGEFRQRIVAEESTAKVRLNLYAADINLAARAIQRGDYGLARRTLAALRPGTGETDLRGFEWRHLWKLCQGDQLATLGAHEWIVTCAAFSPDGKLIATGSQDGTVKIWDAVKQERVTTLPGQTNTAVWTTEFTPDGKSLMTGGHAGIRFWNTTTWQLGTQVPGQLAALSKTGSVLAVAGSSPFAWEPAGKVTLWDYVRNEKLSELDKPGRILALSPDGRTLAVAGESAGIELWDHVTGRWLRSLTTEQPVWALNFSPDGSLLLSAGWSSEVSVWKLKTQEPPGQLKGHFLTVWSAAFSPDGSTIVTTGSDQTIRLWDATTLRQKNILRGHGNEVWCAAFNPDGKTLVTGGKDQQVLLWSAVPEPAPDHLPNANLTRPIFSPDGSKLLTVIPDSGRHSALWELDRHTRRDGVPDYELIGFSPDGKQVLHPSDDYTALERWPTRDNQTNRIKLEGREPGMGPFSQRGFSPAGDIFFAIDNLGRIQFWKAESGKLLETIQGPTPPLRAARLGPTGTYLAVSLERENSIRLYARATGHETPLAGHRDFVSGLAFSPDGNTLASGSMDGTIRLWSTVDGKPLATLPGHMQEATDVAFSPDGNTLASVSRGESLKLWHVPTQRELLSVDFPEAGGFLLFSPDGRHLAVTTEENSLRLFEAPVPVDEAKAQ